jgi:YfiH family protein
MGWIEANWPAPPGVRAGVTTRIGGASGAPWDSFNLATHVGDCEKHVTDNRRRLAVLLDLPAEPVWLDQRHGNRIIDLDAPERGVAADGAYSAEPGRVCAVLTADCIPLLLTDRGGREIAAVHIGWRGLCAGILDSALHRFRAPAGSLMAWVGPHIGRQCYEIGDEVRRACLASVPDGGPAFEAAGESKWRADMGKLAELGLRARGVEAVFFNGCCTCSEADLFYSFRRDRRTGRMASLIWRRG